MKLSLFLYGINVNERGECLSGKQTNFKHESAIILCTKNRENPRYEGIMIFFLILDCEAIGTAATPGLLCQPRVIMKMIVEK
jgi:hypothetical protein